MAVVQPVPISSPPPAPDRADRASFPGRADAWVAWEQAELFPKINDLAQNVYSNATDAASSATAAANSASGASGSATTAGTARDDAIAARNAAQSARDLAAGSASTASGAATTAGTARDDAIAARNDAQQARTDAQTAATNAGSSATAAANSATQAGSTLVGTSTTSNTLGTGTKTFTASLNKAWAPGATRLTAGSAGTPGATISGLMTAYTPSPGVLALQADSFTGTAGNAYTDWNIAVTGAAGANGGSSTLTHVTGTTQTTVAGGVYSLENVGLSTVTLNATPADGERATVLVANGRADNVIARNGKKIMGLTEDMTLVAAGVPTNLIYNATTGDWRFI